MASAEDQDGNNGDNKTVDSNLIDAVNEGRWCDVRELMNKGPSEETRSWLLEEVCKHGDEKLIVHTILHHLEKDAHLHLFSVLPWLLGRDEDKVARIAATWKPHNLKFHLIPVTAVNSILTRGMWKAAGAVLCKSRFPENHDVILQVALQNATEDDLRQYILPHVSYVNSVLALAADVIVLTGKWRAARGLLHNEDYVRSTGETLVENACKFASTENLLPFVYECGNSMVDSALDFAVMHGRWSAVGVLLHRKTQPQTANSAGSNKLFDADEHSHVLHQYINLRQETVLKMAIDQNVWQVANQVLKTHEVGGSRRRWILEQASERADSDSLLQLLPHCVSENMSYVLLASVRRCLWKVVIYLLKTAKLHCTHRRWAFEEACKRADQYNLTAMIHYGYDDQMDVFLQESLRRELWDAVAAVLKSGRLATEQRRQAVEEAFMRANEDGALNILPHVCDDRLDSVLRETMDRGWWRAVGKILEHKLMEDSHYKWAVEEASLRADESGIMAVFPHLRCDQLQFVLRKAVDRGLWSAVGEILKSKQLGNEERRWALVEACRRPSSQDMSSVMCHCEKDQVKFLLEESVKHGSWKVVQALLPQQGIGNAQFTLALCEACKRCTDREFQDFMPFTRRHDNITPVLMLLASRNRKGIVFDILKGRLSLKRPRSADEEVHKTNAAYQFALLIIESLQTEQVLPEEDRQTYCDKLYEHTVSFYEHTARGFMMLWRRRFSEESVSYDESLEELFKLLIKHLESVCCERDLLLGFNAKIIYVAVNRFLERRHIIDAMRVCFVFPLLLLQRINLDIQAEARAKMSYIWEDVRRSLFWDAVTSEDWTLVKLLSDHSLYDDQRAWGLKKALNAKQWDVVVVLAAHGLTDDQLRRVNRQVAKHADWDLVRELFEQGADVQCVREDLETANPSRERLPTQNEMRKYELRFQDDPKLEKQCREKWEKIEQFEKQYKERCSKITEMETQIKFNGRHFEDALEERNWSAVLYRIRERNDQKRLSLALQQAVQDKAWHVVMHLVRCGMDAAQRDSLFLQAVKQKAWGVVRLLLERIVSLDLCRAALPQFEDAKQWILVARVMEYNVDDDRRRSVLQKALDNREGSVVAHIISVMEGRITAEERHAIYETAERDCVLQAIKRLVEEKDETGTAQRNKTLVESVANQRWELVKHCTLHGADIDMEVCPNTSEHFSGGKTMLQELSEDLGNNEHVRGLLKHGANQFMPDSEGYTPLHRAVRKEVGNDDSREYKRTHLFEKVEALVEFQGDINQKDPLGKTPLYHLIRAKQWEILDCALLWGRDVSKEVGHRGYTALHVICRAGLWDSVRYMVARGGDPLAVTDRGKTPFAMAVDSNSLETIAECIKMGVSTHQPAITDSMEKHRTPMERAVKRRDDLLIEMLYESGSCSNREIRNALDMYKKLAWDYVEKKMRETSIVDFIHFAPSPDFLVRLRSIARNPRSLLSTCRLVISHHIGISKPRTREKKVQQLPLEDKWKKYVLFSDLTDKDFGKSNTGDGDDEDWSDVFPVNYDIYGNSPFETPLDIFHRTFDKDKASSHSDYSENYDDSEHSDDDNADSWDESDFDSEKYVIQSETTTDLDSPTDDSHKDDVEWLKDIGRYEAQRKRKRTLGSEKKDPHEEQECAKCHLLASVESSLCS